MCYTITHGDEQRVNSDDEFDENVMRMTDLGPPEVSAAPVPVPLVEVAVPAGL